MLLSVLLSRRTGKMGIPALLLVAKSDIQKLPTKQAHSENQWLSLQQRFKYNVGVKPSKTKLFLYQQLYSCVTT